MPDYSIRSGVSATTAPGWNHNIHYYDFVLRSMPENCRRALDVGCGAGMLARRLATRCPAVTAIDLDGATLRRAREAGGRIDFVEGDALTHEFAAGGFDFIASVAALHHLPLEPALARFRDLLRPGGVLVVIGLYRSRTIVDYAWSAAAFPASWTLRSLRGSTEVGAPVRDPRETLAEIRSACDRILPGAELRRRLLFRYSLVWWKPRSNSALTA